MKLHRALSDYARLVVVEIPMLACAKRLGFTEVADFRAVLSDCSLVRQYDPDRAHRSESREEEFFRRALGAAEVFEKSGYGAVYAEAYRALLGLVPRPIDTKWKKTSWGWECVSNGWEVSATHYPARRLSRGVDPAHCVVRADAAGVAPHNERVSIPIAEARKHIDDWAKTHDVTEQRRWKIAALVAENGGGT